jgi:hypothetical protein
MTTGAEPGTRQRRFRLARWAAVGLLALAIACLIAIVASAATDRPVTMVGAQTEIAADKATVWATLIDFGAYETWNPFVVKATGATEAGGKITMNVLVGDELHTKESTITIFHPERKLRWQSRVLLPGLRDEEVEVILDPIADGRVRARLQYRTEGLLAPLADEEGRQEGLEAMAAALKQQAEAAA